MVMIVVACGARAVCLVFLGSCYLVSMPYIPLVDSVKKKELMPILIIKETIKPKNSHVRNLNFNSKVLHLASMRY